jgi:hypothetical protein
MAGKSVLEACSSDRASLPARCNKSGGTVLGLAPTAPERRGRAG